MSLILHVLICSLFYQYFNILATQMETDNIETTLVPSLTDKTTDLSNKDNTVDSYKNSSSYISLSKVLPFKLRMKLICKDVESRDSQTYPTKDDKESVLSENGTSITPQICYQQNDHPSNETEKNHPTNNTQEKTPEDDRSVITLTDNRQLNPSITNMLSDHLYYCKKPNPSMETNNYMLSNPINVSAKQPKRKIENLDAHQKQKRSRKNATFNSAKEETIVNPKTNSNDQEKNFLFINYEEK